MTRLWLVAALLFATAAPLAAAPAAAAFPDVVDVSGRAWTSRDLRGKVVVLAFWARWCPTCLRELPELARLRARHGGEVEVVGVCLDGGSRRDLSAWLARHRYDFPQVQEGHGFEGGLARQFAVDRVPGLLLFDRNGSLAVRDVAGGQLSPLVSALLAR